MRKFLKSVLPKPAWEFVRNFCLRNLGFRPQKTGETAKAKDRRTKEGFFEKYCQGYGIDIGYGGDLVVPNCIGWDFEHGDAQYMAGAKDNIFDFVYSSHTLEDMENLELTLKNWYRILKPKGYLILYIPDRELYEKKKTLPSNWNPGHRHFFLLNTDEAPDTVGAVPLIKRAFPDAEIIYAKECSQGHTIKDPNLHSDGEYSIEAVIRKT